MKKKLSIAAMLLFVCISAGAQKFALVDMEYILNRIPAYERANEQLNQFSKRWQAEVEALNLEAQTLYKNYQNESLFLSEEQKSKKEEEIVAKEKQASDLKRQYFGPDGELYKKQESLMSPIQDEIYEAIKQISEIRPLSTTWTASNHHRFRKRKVQIPHLPLSCSSKEEKR